MRKNRSTSSPEITATTAMGSDVLSPPSPTRGEAAAPNTQEVTPSRPEALPAPSVWAAMASEKLVDAEAVKEALHEGKISEYVVDFPDEKTINSEKIIVIPHLGASTEEAEDNCAVMAGKELMEYIENGNITNSVNYPGVNKARTGKVRTCILFNAADKDDVEKIAGDKEVAVKGDYGYAVFDGDAAVKFDKAIRIRTIA